MNDLPSPAEQFPAGTLLFRGTNVLGSVPVHVKGNNNELFLPLQRLRIKPAVDHTPQPLDLRPVPAHDERRCLGKPGKAFRITPADSGVSINGAATAAALCPRRILQPLVRGNRTGTQKNTGSKRRRYFDCSFPLVDISPSEPYFASRFGRVMEIAGMYVMRIRPISKAIKNGMIFFTRSANGILPIPHATNRFTPTGGVIKPMARLTTMMIPKWMMLTP